MNIIFPFSQSLMLLADVSEIAVGILIPRDILFLETNTKEMRHFPVIFNVSFLIWSWQIIHAQWTNRWHFVTLSTTWIFYLCCYVLYYFGPLIPHGEKDLFLPKIYAFVSLLVVTAVKMYLLNVLISIFFKKISSSQRYPYLQKLRKKIDEFLKVICSLTDQLVSGRQGHPFLYRCSINSIRAGNWKQSSLAL